MQYSRAALIALMAFPMFLMGCQDRPTVRLSGVRTEISYSLPPFESISASGIFELVLNPGDEERITIRTDTAILPFLHVTVQDKELRIDMDKIKIKKQDKTSPSEEIFPEIEVVYRGIKRLAYRGVGVLRTGDTLRATALKLIHKGVGALYLDAVVDGDIDVMYEGVGEMLLTGRAQRMHLKASGVGKIDAGAFRVVNGVVEARGVGEVVLFVTDTLWLGAKGIGEMSFTEKPRIIRPYGDDR